jgi:PAT family beta-lactamase induction signal transducer AmpG
MSTLWRQVQTPGGLTTLLIVFSYKFGEAVSDNMFKPYLLDQGFSKAQISMWTGVYGMGFSTAGSLAGGFVVNQLANRCGHQESDRKVTEQVAGGSNSVLLSAVTLASALEAVAQIGRFCAACASAGVLSSEHGQLALQALIMYESFCGGLLTTIIFTYMMASVDKSIGARATPGQQL